MSGCDSSKRHSATRRRSPPEIFVTSASQGGRRKRVGRDFELALELPAAFGVDGVLQLRLLFEQLVHCIFAEIGIGELVADRIEAVDQRLNFARRLR